MEIMKIKYSPCKSGTDTIIKVLNADTLQIDGEHYEFSPLDVQWPDISEQTDGVIQEAHREDGELFVTVRRFYTQECASWDTADYHEVTP
jgi:hypothetical protein